MLSNISLRIPYHYLDHYRKSALLQLNADVAKTKKYAGKREATNLLVAVSLTFIWLLDIPQLPWQLYQINMCQSLIWTQWWQTKILPN